MLRIAHRGASGQHPENTMSAFKKAVAVGVDMVELDIRICKTGEPIVMHDKTVDRTTNGKGKVTDLPLSKIKQLRSLTGEPVPSLTDVLDTLGGKTILNLDIKTRQTAIPVVKLLQKYIKDKKINYDDVILASANVLTLRKIFFMDTRFRLSVIVRYLPKLITKYTYRFQPFSVQPLAKVTTKKLVNQLHKKDIKVFPWALKSNEDGKKFIQKMEKVEPDGIISFFPEKIIDTDKE